MSAGKLQAFTEEVRDGRQKIAHQGVERCIPQKLHRRQSDAHTSGAGLEEGELRALLNSVRAADNFNADNDPYKEHDFGSIDQGGEQYYWKIDYYDPGLQGGSDDPTKTCRVLTIMRADEY
jgi:hypothetical protein